MAPELFDLNEGKSGLCTCESDVFALGMVTFEVRNIYRGSLFYDFEYLSRTSSCSLDKCRSQRMPRQL